MNSFVRVMGHSPPRDLTKALLEHYKVESQRVKGFVLPSFLLIYGALPYWNSLRQNSGVQAALRGANAAVVGILLGALYNPVWTVAVDSPKAFTIALAAFGLLQIWHWPPWLLVVLCGAAGFVFLRL
jgi:chromate transporter